MLLESTVAGTALRFTLTRTQRIIESLAGGRADRLDVLKTVVRPGQPCRLTVLRRGAWLGVLRDDALIFRSAAVQPPLQRAGVTGERGWAIIDARIHQLEPVVFADNFMRIAYENGGWTVHSGHWALQSAWDTDPKGNANRFTNAIYALNPFAWAGRAASGSALCTAGKPFWEDYTLTAAVRPSAGTVAGVVVNVVDVHNYLLVRWRPVNDNSASDKELCVYRVTNDVPTRLAQNPGGFLPGQWYKLAVVCTLDDVQLLVDGLPRLTIKDPTPWRGGVGLYVEGPGAVFDSLTVYGQTLKTDLCLSPEDIGRHYHAGLSAR